MKFFIFLLILLTFISCAQIENRAPSNLQEEINYTSTKAFKKAIKGQESEVNLLKKNMKKFFLYAAYKPDNEKLRIFKVAELYFSDSFKKISKNIKNRELQSGEAVLEILNPPSWTLESEIKWLENELIKSNSTGGDYLAPALKQIAKIDFQVLDLKGNDFWTNEDFEIFMEALKSDSSETEVPLATMKVFENKITKYFEKIRNVGTELSESGQVDFPDAEVKKFFVKFLDYYYSNVDVEVIKNILNDVSDLGRQATQEELVSIMFQNSGPGLGKTLQQLSKEPNVSDALKRLVDFLEDAGKKVPLYMIEDLVKMDVGSFKLSNISVDPLGTGTMAQVNKASLTINGKKRDVALRFLKPGIEKRVEEDLKILAGFVEQMGTEGELSEDFLPSARKLVESISEFLKSELSITDAIKKQDFAKKVYTRNREIKLNRKKYKMSIKVPEVYYPANGKTTKLHVQEFIEFGEKYSKIKDHNIQEAVARYVMETWFDEALLKSGFIHSDLHQGNFTVRNITNDSAEIVLFDFGMSETLTKETRQSFILIGAGVEIKNPKLIVEGLEMMSKDGVGKDLRREMLEKVKAQINIIEKTEDWIVWALKEGYLKNDQLGTLARGGILISQLGKIIDKEEIAKEIVQSLLSKNALKAFAIKNDYPLTKGQVIKLGVGSCLFNIKSFFLKK